MSAHWIVAIQASKWSFSNPLVSGSGNKADVSKMRIWPNSLLHQSSHPKLKGTWKGLRLPWQRNSFGKEQLSFIAAVRGSKPHTSHTEAVLCPQWMDQKSANFSSAQEHRQSLLQHCIWKSFPLLLASSCKAEGIGQKKTRLNTKLVEHRSIGIARRAWWRQHHIFIHTTGRIRMISPPSLVN